MSEDAQRLNLEAVTRYLAAHLPGFEGPVSAEKFPVGQSNPTYRLRAASGEYVLRRKPPGVLLKSAHAVDREFRVQRALAATQVPVAEMHLLCRDASIIGSEFYVMALVEGRNFMQPTLDALPVPERGAAIDEMGRVLAALHEVDLGAVGLGDYGPKGDYLPRQIARWTRQYRATQTEVLADMEALIAVMETRVPAEDGQRTLVHGDYRIDNLIFAPDRPRLAAVLDWELSTTGHPYADLAGVLMQWQMPADATGRGLAGIDRAAQGLPSDAAFVAAYAERRGKARIENLHVYVAFCFFRMAAILQGVYRRALEGNASNPEAGLALSAQIPIYAEKGLAAMEATALSG